MVFRTRAGQSAEHTSSKPQRDAGYTLVELLFYSSLLVLILTVVGGMLLNTITSEQKVLDSAQANSSSQVIASSVQSGVRNATALVVTDIADSDDQLLVATTVSSDKNVSDMNGDGRRAWMHGMLMMMWMLHDDRRWCEPHDER